MKKRPICSRRARRGFTVVEIVVAVLVLSIGVLGLATTMGVVTKLVAGGRAGELGGSFAMRRMELLRTTACTSQSTGADTLYRGGSWSAINSWSFTSGGANLWRVKLINKHRAGVGTRSDTVETSVQCLF